MSEQKTGGSVDYYKCHVADPIDPNAKPYTAESIDIIEALGMTFAEAKRLKRSGVLALAAWAAR